MIFDEDENWIVKDKDPALHAAKARLDEATRSDDPELAAKARLVRHMVIAMENIMKEEQALGTPSGMIMFSLPYALSTIGSSMTATLSRGEPDLYWETIKRMTTLLASLLIDPEVPERLAQMKRVEFDSQNAKREAIEMLLRIKTPEENENHDALLAILERLRNKEPLQ